MNNNHSLRFLHLTIVFTLLFSPLPLPIIAKNLAETLSHDEQKLISHDDEIKYIYVGKPDESTHRLISRIKKLDKNAKSLLDDLLTHIENNCAIASYDQVIGTFKYAEAILLKNYHKARHKELSQLYDDFIALTDKILSGQLTVRPESLETDILNSEKTPPITRARLATFNITDRLKVIGKSRFNRNISGNGRLRIRKNADFRDRANTLPLFYEQPLH